MDNRAIKFKILKLLDSPDYRPMSMHDVMAKLKIPSRQRTAFFAAVTRLEGKGDIEQTESGKLLSNRNGGSKEAVILSIGNKGAFARLKSEDPKVKLPDVFISSENLSGAMPQDTVKVKITRKTQDRTSGVVMNIEKHGFTEFTGIFHRLGKNAFVVPTQKYKNKIAVDSKHSKFYNDGDLVFARMKTYATRKHEASAEIVESYGNCDSAKACCQAILAKNHARLVFPKDVLEEAKTVSEHFKVDGKRTDLRELPIFTIDGATAKDLDDAVSVEETDGGYRLGVHIADVSNYVRENSKLDGEAFMRGTSIYYGNSVIPMLPKELSNGICSLNPNEDRLTFSCFMDISAEGKLLSYKIEKSVIRSRVKGVYTEVNEIFDNTASPEILEKYKEVIPSLTIMRKLALILRKAKSDRGAIDFASDEAQVVINDKGVCVGVEKRERGEAERLIEEFMLLANEAVASIAVEKKLPFVYRIHEEPELTKLEDLAVSLRAAGIDAREIKPGLKPMALKKALEKTKDTPKEKAINSIALRCMSKARYAPDCLGHFGLALENYCHFTSPIRRYPDLSIHRILSELLNGATPAWLTGHFKVFATDSSLNSSDREVAAMQVEWDCEDAYKAEYMGTHIGERFMGVVSSIKSFGMYVMLDNTVEGLVKVENMPGWFDFDETNLTLRNPSTGKMYSIGDEVEIIVQGADVPTGKIDFSLI